MLTIIPSLLYTTYVLHNNIKNDFVYVMFSVLPIHSYSKPRSLTHFQLSACAMINDRMIRMILVIYEIYVRLKVSLALAKLFSIYFLLRYF